MPWYASYKKQKRIKIPNNLFDDVIEYDDVKHLLFHSLRSKRPTHVLLIGPPASAKSLILLCMQNIPSSTYILGGRTTKAGLSYLLFTNKPKFLLIDELDKMNVGDMTILLSLMEYGIVKSVKYKQIENVKLNTHVYAASNTDSSIPVELLSRFHFKLYFKAYTLEEFQNIAMKVLVNKENVKPNLAEYIITKIQKYSRDIRDCIGLARIASNKQEVDNIIKTLSKYRRKAIWYP